MTVMNDELERLIFNNRRSIQDDEPLEGHFERFEARLLKASKPSSTINFSAVLKVAAIVVFALLAVNQTRLWLSPERKEVLSLGSISEEYREVEFYYTNAIEVGMNQWEKLSNEGLVSVAEQEMMQKEQQEFDQMYQKLQKDLEANPDDERVINAMIEYYQARMNIINLIINKLQEVKQQKNNKNHEIEI
jgi:cytochrome c-type biogenesis protein CcmH/NrfG